MQKTGTVKKHHTFVNIKGEYNGTGNNGASPDWEKKSI
jgi:hypothetical protein